MASVDSSTAPKAIRRILSLDSAGLLWGSERALLDFIGEIPGFESACCLPPNSPLTPKLQARGVHCLPYFQKNLHLRGMSSKLLAFIGLVRAITEFRPHILHVNQAGASRIALIACRIFKIPCITHIRLLEDIEYLNELRPSATYLKHIIAVSLPIADEIARQPALREIPCTTLLDAYRSFKSHGLVAPVTTKWDLVCVGRLSENKGQRLLISALGILRDRGIILKTLLVGEVNEFGTQLLTEIQASGLADSVELAGHRDRVDDILMNANWLICPSVYEPLGRVLFEAWDVGIPVIAGAKSGGAASSIIASGGGVLFDEWTPLSLANCIFTIRGMDRVERVRMAENGREWMLNATDPGRYAKFIGHLCREIILEDA